MYRKDDTMNSDNLRILNALKAIADKLGADDKANVSENENGRIAEELERIAMIKDLKPEPSGGGGGGSSGGLVVHVIDGTADKIWQEIHDAVASGSGAVVIFDDTNCYQVQFCGYDTDLQTYIVFCSDSIGYTNLIAESQSGYPRPQG